MSYPKNPPVVSVKRLPKHTVRASPRVQEPNPISAVVSKTWAGIPTTGWTWNGVSTSGWTWNGV